MKIIKLFLMLLNASAILALFTGAGKTGSDLSVEASFFIFNTMVFSGVFYYMINTFDKGGKQ